MPNTKINRVNKLDYGSVEEFQDSYKDYNKKIREVINKSSLSNFKRSLFCLDNRSEFKEFCKNFIGLHELEIFKIFYLNKLDETVENIEKGYEYLTKYKNNLRVYRRKNIELNNKIHVLLNLGFGLTYNRININEFACREPI